MVKNDWINILFLALFNCKEKCIKHVLKVQRSQIVSGLEIMLASLKELFVGSGSNLFQVYSIFNMK